MSTYTMQERIERAYNKALATIGTLQELAEYEDSQHIDTSDTLAELYSATEHACAYARALGIDYDSDYDC